MNARTRNQLDAGARWAEVLTIVAGMHQAYAAAVQISDRARFSVGGGARLEELRKWLCKVDLRVDPSIPLAYLALGILGHSQGYVELETLRHQRDPQGLGREPAR